MAVLGVYSDANSLFQCSTLRHLAAFTRMADLSFCIVCFVGHTIGNNTTSQERKYTIYYLGRFSFPSLFIMSRFFLGLTFSFISCALAAQTFDETIAVKIGDKIVELEVARTSVEHRTGLMNRSYLPADHGMLFVFAAPRPTAMWMKNTLIDLDAAFIDACGRITQIVSMQNGSLELHHSRVAASRVIEMNAGWFARNNVKAGTLIPALADNRYCKHTSADTAAQ